MYILMSGCKELNWVVWSTVMGPCHLIWELEMKIVIVTFSVSSILLRLRVDIRENIISQKE